jgi:hypothetical protein
MRSQWLLMAASALSTLLLGIGLIRWLAPGLLGVPTDLQLVKVSKTLPPFFEGVFREESEREPEGFLLNDPYTKVRGRPLNLAIGGLGEGPNDLLGFRNRGVPNVADVVVLGDSQTYGNNAVLDENWPSQLAGLLKARRATVYNMALGS